jgi:flagellar motor switch protein FliM
MSRIILEDWGKAWSSFIPVKCEYNRSEVNPKLAMIVPPNDVVIGISFEIEIENVHGKITFCVPFSNLEPVKDKLTGDSFPEEKIKDPLWDKSLRREMQSVPVEIKAVLGQTQLKGKDLLNLSPGDIIPLNKFSTDDLIIFIEGVPKYKAQPGTFHGNNSVQITELIERR